MTDTNQLPPLPTLLRTRVVDGVPCISVSEHEYQMREYALQAIAQAAQPAEVTLDEVMQAAKKATAPEWQDVIDGWHMGLDLMAFARAILALRPVHVPMTDEDMMSCLASATGDIPARVPQGWRNVMRAVEAHHGITAQAKKGTP